MQICGKMGQNILEEICLKYKCDLGFVLKNEGKENQILYLSGQINAEQEELQSLVKQLAQKNVQSLQDIKQSKTYKAFCSKFGFSSLFIEKLILDSKASFFLILFSKNKIIDSTEIDKDISPLLQDIKKLNDKTLEKKLIVQNETTNDVLESKQIAKEVLEGVNIVLFSTNPDGSKFNFISAAVRTLFGYSPEEVYDKKFQLLKSIRESDVVSYYDFLLKLKNGDESVLEYRIHDRFGKEHWVRHSGLPIIKNNMVISVVGTIQDITEEKKIQLRLENSEERFRMLIDTAEDLIFILNGFGCFGMVNKNGANALGYTPDEMIGKHFLEFIDKESEMEVAAAFNKILTTDGITTFETTFLDRFDKGVMFEVSAKPMLTDGQVSGMLSIGRNITRRKQDEQKIRDLNTKLVEANRIISIERERARHKITVLEELNKLKGEFISNVSHELRTPLASIVGFAETILSDSELPKSTIQEFSNIILMEGKRLGKLINDILDFSKLQSGDEELYKESTNVLSIINDVIRNFSEQIKEKNFIISKEFPPNDLIISIDRERILKVISNLMSNAIKYTTPGGRISFIVQDFGKEIEIAVTDTGVGIPEDELPKLFQKFSKVQQSGNPLGGAGFGLVSAKQIIDLHKGFIKVRSQVNKGTTFIIRLPK
jgi:PAS domain S-box-containing protein